MAHHLTAFFCRRAAQLGVTEADWLAGRAKDLVRRVFAEDRVEAELRPLIPDANTWWDRDHQGSNGTMREWRKWLMGGRGPVRGWLYHLLHEGEDGGHKYVRSLKGWERRSGVIGRWAPLRFEPIYEDYDPASDANVDRRNNDRRPITSSEAEQVYQAGRGRCHYCDTPVGGDASGWQVDHFMKRSAIATNRQLLDVIDNYVSACLSCHDEKTRADLTGAEMRGRIQDRRLDTRRRGRR